MANPRTSVQWIRKKHARQQAELLKIKMKHEAGMLEQMARRCRMRFAIGAGVPYKFPLRIMIPTRNLLTLDIPELAAYKTMRRPQEHRDAGLFVAEGEKTVRRLLESPLRVRNLLLPPHWLEEYTPLIQKRFDSGESIDIFTADKKLLESLTGFSFYQGVLAMAEVPAPVEPIQWLATDRARPKTFVAIEDVTNTGNMGMIARNCAALGADLLIAGQRCCSPYIRGAVHASMGTIFSPPPRRAAQFARVPALTSRAGNEADRRAPEGGFAPADPEQFARGCVCGLWQRGAGADRRDSRPV
ncbi:TrmH family RNA methyltransferase [Oscillatoria amoena NRMC-F 0135]|nr:TrmH family RNA methyltransferase [Oscillatoria amoena NRMC-F 0135]